jgi:hypothetical protein
MENNKYSTRSRITGIATRYLGLLMVILTVGFTITFISFTGGDTIDLVAEDLMIEPKPLVAVAGFMLLALLLSGLISASRFARGWIAVFCFATFLTTMTVLMGIGELPIIRNAFLVMFSTVLVVWAAAVSYYMYDLYS